MKPQSWLLLVLLLALPAVADEDDDTLRAWLAKADLVVAGQVATEPLGSNGETGVPHYTCDFKIAEVLKGDAALTGKVISVSIVRFERAAKDRHPLLQKEAECILFLKNVAPDKPAWRTADMWFGLQHAGPWLTGALKRVANENLNFAIKCQRAEDQIAISKEDDRVVFTVTSPRGIGSATITRQGQTWPETMVLRLKLKGLESLRVDNGRDLPLLASYQDKEAIQLKNDAFEFVVPRERLSGAVKTITINWVDFYR